MNDSTDDLTQMTPEQASARIDEAVAKALREASSFTPSPTLTGEDRELAIDVLTAETGSREAALEKFALDPPNDLGSRIAAEKQKRADVEKAQKDTEFAASPAGRRVAAQAAADAQAKLAADAESARTLLRYEGQTPLDLIESISDLEAIELAGMADPPPTPETVLKPRTPHQQEIADLVGDRWWGLDEYTRRQECERLGVSFDEAKAYKQNELDTDPRWN